MAEKTWKKIMKKNNIVVKALPERLDKMARSAIIGGRSQCFEKGVMNEATVLIDAVSLYATVMEIHYFPIEEEVVETDEYSSMVYNQEGLPIKRIGFYMCEFEQSQLKKKIIPFREVMQPLDWTSDKIIKTYLSTIDIEILRRHGVEVKTFKDEKIKQDHLKELKNPSMREVCKLSCNGLSGKFAQAVVRNTWSFASNNDDRNCFIDKCEIQTITFKKINGSGMIFLEGNKKNAYKQKYAKPSHIAALIYAYARQYMYENIYMKVAVIYTDTDSALIRLMDLHIIEELGLIGNDF